MPIAPRRLIISADDFGMSPAVNAAIIRAHRDGVLTQASLMVNGKAADEAVELAKQNPQLAVGLHLALVQGYPVSPAAEIPLLMGHDGTMRMNPVWAGVRYFFSPGARSQLRREIEAQLTRFRDTGLPLSHVDGHLTVHLHPSVAPILISLAGAYGIRAMRLSRDPLAPALRYDSRHAARKVFEATAFTALSRLARPQLDANRIAYADRVIGMHQTGHLNEDYLLSLIPSLPDGLTEIYCHAGTVDDEARRWRPVDYDPEGELAALLSPRVRAAIEAYGIERTSYREIAAPVAKPDIVKNATVGRPAGRPYDES